jgi:hypothetical protein
LTEGTLFDRRAMRKRNMNGFVVNLNHSGKGGKVGKKKLFWCVAVLMVGVFFSGLGWLRKRRRKIPGNGNLHLILRRKIQNHCLKRFTLS